MEPVSTGLIALVVGSVGRYCTRKESAQDRFYRRSLERLEAVERDLEEYRDLQEVWWRERRQLGDKLLTLEDEVDRARNERMEMTLTWAEKETALACEIVRLKEELAQHKRTCPGTGAGNTPTPPSEC